MIVGPGVTEILPSADYRYLLVQRETRPLKWDANVLTEDMDAPGEVTLFWWNVRTHRSSSVWRHKLAPGEKVDLQIRGWLGNTKEAILKMWIGDKVNVLFLNPSTGAVREMVIPPKTYDGLSPSPALHFVGLVGADASCDEEIQFIGKEGTISEPIRLPCHIFFTRWSEDGKTYRGIGSITGADGKSVEQWYAVDPVARTVSPIEKPKPAPNGEVDYNSFSDPADALPIRLTQDPYNRKEPTRPRAIYLEAFPKGTEQITVSMDGQPLFIFPDGSGVIFRRDSALYFAPLFSTPVSVAKPVSRELSGEQE